jgi:3-oxoacyl-[acyl-carrier-protein] synthase-3
MRAPMIYLGAFSESLGEAYPIESAPAVASDEVISQLLDDGHRFYRRTDRQPWELAADCAGKTLAAGNQRPDLVVYCSNTLRSPDDRTRGPAAFLASLDLADVQLIGITMGGCGNVGIGLTVAASMLKSGAASCVLLVTTDVAPPGWRTVRNGVGIFSDGAASCMLSTAAGGGDLRMLGVASGANWQMYMPGFGGTDLVRGRSLIRGLKRAIYPVWQDGASRPEDITHLVTHNYRTSMLNLFGQVAGVAPARIYAPTRADIAHCYSADTLINLSQLSRAELPDTSRLLVLSTGTHQWTAALIEPAAS